jgi:uncharacterized protein Yka (UPF0111/DUF47 family)
LRVSYFGELVYWDRNRGGETTENEIIKSMDRLDDKTREALEWFLRKYPTQEDKMLYWCKQIQRTARSYLKQWAKELEQTLTKSENLKEVNENINKQKERERLCKVIITT